MEKKSDKPASEFIRPPIVVVMGHIDHGKTTILDWFRKTKVAEKESGGITQHIGAYIVEHTSSHTREKKRITFIDTPGHEAFSRLRSRGANVADIAVLVIAAEEGMKPQTKEALELIRSTKTPFVVAINKIDKPEANSERVKQDLAKEEVFVESYGGKVPSVEVSGKTGKNMDELLEMILLMADLEHLRANPAKQAEGVIVEAHRDPKRGTTATLLIRDGSLHSGDYVVAGTSAESVRVFENFAGATIREAGPSEPVRLAGFKEMPAVGEAFSSFAKRGDAQAAALSAKSAEGTAKKSNGVLKESGKPIFNLVLKADVVGSLEALEGLVKRFESDHVGINILRSDTGDINESDVKLARATGHVTIIGFRVRVDSPTRLLAEKTNVHILTGDVIYELVDEVKKEIEAFIPSKITRVDLGKAKVIKVFKKDGARHILGGRVMEGELKKGAFCDVVRMKDVVGRGTIIQVQHNKIDTSSVGAGNEFGALVEFRGTVEEGDIFHIFEEEVTKFTM